jgi:hypothetical protein
VEQNQKLIAASIEALVFIGVLLVALRFRPSSSFLILSHSSFTHQHRLNILGVARTSYHFLSIARSAKKTFDYAQTDFLTSLPTAPLSPFRL